MEKGWPMILPVQQTGKSTDENGTSPAAYSTLFVRIALKFELYHLQMPRTGGRPKAAMPYRAERRHQFWSVDLRYLDMHRLPEVEMVYCITILENFSRAVLASAISVRQDTEAFFAVLYAAIRKYGVPEVLVSDNGSIFTSHATRQLCDQLGMAKQEIKKGKPYQNYIESMFNVQRHMADWSFEKARPGKTCWPRTTSG